MIFLNNQTHFSPKLNVGFSSIDVFVNNFYGFTIYAVIVTGFGFLHCKSDDPKSPKFDSSRIKESSPKKKSSIL